VEPLAPAEPLCIETPVEAVAPVEVAAPVVSPAPAPTFFMVDEAPRLHSAVTAPVVAPSMTAASTWRPDFVESRLAAEEAPLPVPVAPTAEPAPVDRWSRTFHADNLDVPAFIRKQME
jgi:hypothetical protein